MKQGTVEWIQIQSMGESEATGAELQPYKSMLVLVREQSQSSARLEVRKVRAKMLL